MLDDGMYASVSEIGDAENISKSYVSRILRMALLAPDLVEAVLEGRPTAGLPNFLEPFSVEWEAQRERLGIGCVSPG
jgi:hypothetical protein